MPSNSLASPKDLGFLYYALFTHVWARSRLNTTSQRYWGHTWLDQCSSGLGPTRIFLNTAYTHFTSLQSRLLKNLMHTKKKSSAQRNTLDNAWTACWTHKDKENLPPQQSQISSAGLSHQMPSQSSHSSLSDASKRLGIPPSMNQKIRALKQRINELEGRVGWTNAQVTRQTQSVQNLKCCFA